MIVAPLTERERDVLRTVCEAGSARAASKILDLSEQTIKNHLQSVRQKTDTKSTAGAVYILMREQGAI